MPSISAGWKAAVTTITSAVTTAPTTVPSCRPACDGARIPSPHRPTSFPSAVSDTSPREGSQLNTSPFLPMGTQVSPRPSGVTPPERLCAQPSQAVKEKQEPPPSQVKAWCGAEEGQEQGVWGLGSPGLADGWRAGLSVVSRDEAEGARGCCHQTVRCQVPWAEGTTWLETLWPSRRVWDTAACPET